MRRNPWFLIAIGGLILAALFAWMRPASAPADARQETPQTPPIPTDTETHEVTLRIEQGQLVGETGTIRIRQYDWLILRISADASDELHLHGYDLSVPLLANRAAELGFLAEHGGRFEFELHSTDQTLGTIEIYPR